MKTLLTVLVVLAAQACTYGPPAGDVDPEIFRLEYDAVESVTSHVHDLGDVGFTYVPWDGMQGDCPLDPDEAPCVGLTHNYEQSDYHLVHLFEPSPGDDRCATLRTPTGHTYTPSLVVIHELLHAAHFHHGDEMDAAEQAAWEALKQAGGCEIPYPEEALHGVF